jgi:phosphatidylserine decarboxylase
VTVTVLSTKHQTPVSKKNINPEYNPKDATFDFPIHMSLAEKLGAIELVVWDKDMLRKEYLGEVSLMLEDWFSNRHGYGFLDAENKVCVYLPSDRSHRLTLNVALVYEPCIHENERSSRGFDPDQARLHRTSASIVSAFVQGDLPGIDQALMPKSLCHVCATGTIFISIKVKKNDSDVCVQTAGVGTIRSNAGGPEYEDDGFSSDENEFEDAHEDFTDDEYGGGGGMSTGTSTPLLPPSRSQQQASSKKPLLSLPLQDHKQEPLGSEVTTPTADELHTPVPRTARPPFMSTPSGSPVRTETLAFPPSGSNEAMGSTKPEGHKSGFSKFIRRPTLPIPLPSGRRTPSRKGTSESTNTTATTPVDETSAEKLERTEKATRPDTKRGKSFGRRKAPGAYNLAGEDDIVGIVMLEIQGASDLPRLSNSTYNIVISVQDTRI